MRKTTVLCLLLAFLLVSGLPALTQGPTQPARTESIGIGDTVTSELSSGAQAIGYKFEGEAGQFVIITLTADEWDTFLVLQDGSGRQLAADDDSGPGSLDSRIGPFRLPAAGSYLIVVTTYDQFYNSGAAPTVGTFTLDLQTVDIRPLEYTQRVEGNLTEQPLIRYYTFSGQAGDVVSVKMASDQLDNYIQLYDADDLSYSLTSANGDPAWIAAFPLPKTGNYILSASSYFADKAGSFTLELDRVTLTPIAFGEEVKAELTARSQSLYYTFQGEIGDIIKAQVDSGATLDTSLTLNNSYGYQVAYSDDAATIDPAIENVILTEAGAYTLIVTPYRAGTTGEISVLVAKSQVASLDEGAVLLRFSSQKTNDMVSFSGSAGDAVRLTIRMVKGETISPNLTITQGGSQIAYASASYVTRQALDLVVPADGTIYVEIDDYTYSDVTVEISVESVPE